MIQLIVSDLDGTLLNSDQQITKRTIRAIKQLQKKGVRLLINTEMNYFDTQQILETYDLQCDIACFEVPVSLIPMENNCMLLTFLLSEFQKCFVSLDLAAHFMKSTVRMDYVFLVPRLDIKIILKMK